MELSPQQWRSNYRAFLWHAVFLALCSSFMDVGTIIPSLLIKAGGTSLQLGILTAIMTGGASLSQLVFAGFLSGRSRKKKFLLLAIHLRVLALLLLAVLLFRSVGLAGDLVIGAIFLLISLFAFSGAFANVSYVDILGKSVLPDSRKHFFSIKQVINAVGVLASTLVVRQLLKELEYPFNYGVLLLVAGLLLWIATGGFWRIHEAGSRIRPDHGLGRYLALIPGELRRNGNLRRYLLIVNTMGLLPGLMPFAVLLAKNRFGLEYGLIGNVLLFRTLGMLTAGLVLYRLASRAGYRAMLIFGLVIGCLVPLLFLVIESRPNLFAAVFLLAGIFGANYRVATGGLLLEISTNENRALYAGISGAGNILTAVFPLLAGWLIPRVGFTVVFTVVAVIVAAGWFVVRRFECRREEGEERPVA